MKYKTFLLETTKHTLDEPSYKTKISEDDAIKLIKEHCKNVDVNKPLFRGMNRGDDFCVIEGQKGGRKSKNTTNHYTLIIDEQLKNKFSHAPLRSKSLICSNNLSYTSSFGNATYALFPYDDVEIGKCEYQDLWDTNIFFTREFRGSIDFINIMLNEVIKNPASYGEIVKAIAKVLDNPDFEDSGDDEDGRVLVYKAFKDIWEDWDDGDEWEDVDKESVVEGVLEQAYDPEHGLNMEFGTYKELEIDELDSNHEFWFGGKCVAIMVQEYKSLLKDGMFE